MDSELPTTLNEVIHALRSDSLPLMTYLEALEARFNAVETLVLALIPEADRFVRLKQEARALLDQFPQAEGRPALFGVPVGVKDIFHVDGFPTRAGSKLPPEALRGPEAASVSALKAAGALVFGKTVTTEFAYFAPGPTRNPRRPQHTPGGSSSGSAAAVAAGLCPLSLGTQTIGSVIRPAAFCGVFGFKPTYDRISRQGVIPLAPSVDHVGFFAADVLGAQAAARVLCQDWKPAGPLPKPVLGIPEGPYMAHAEPEGLEHFRATAHHLEEFGFEIRQVPAMPDFEQIKARHEVIVAAEAAIAHERWYGQYAALYHPRTAALIERGRGVSPEQLQAARAGRQALRDELMALMDRHGLDLWISPAAPGPAPKGLDSTGNPVMNLPWTHAGLPTVNLPAGVNYAGLPMGLQVTARWGADEALLAWATLLAPLTA